ncbi:MAG TPA: rhodanese-like domain-containing protein [Candidatus Binatia bacterium]|jgi:rhodanese-related sulfurtransferase
MAIWIERERVQELVTAGGQLVEVLPEKEFRRIHLSGALSIPLESMTQEKAARLDRGRPVVVYCYDFN